MFSKKRIRALAILFIFIGLIIASYPYFEQMYYDYQLSEVQKEFEEAMVILSNQNDKDFKENSTILENSNEDKSEIIETNELEEIVEQRNANVTKEWPIEGSLEIEKIDLSMPIIEDATLDHLDVSISSINGTGKPWDKGNYALAGHRSLTYGHHFNRLDELEIGDIITIVDLQKNHYTYEVSEKKIIHETDISILENHDYQEVTLITCDPINERNTEMRLIIKGILINQ